MTLIDLTGLTAWWSMDEASGSRLDSHTGGHTLTDESAAASAGAKRGPGALFNSSSSDRMHGGGDAWTQPGSTNFSFVGWVNLSDKSADKTIFSKWKTDTNAANYRGYYKQSSDRFVFAVSKDGTTIFEVEADNLGSPTLDTFYFVYFEHDADGDIISIQVNNGEADTLSHSLGVRGGGGLFFRVGATSDAAASYFDGIIDELSFWGRLLTAAEKTILYNGGVGMSYAAITGDLLVFTATDGSIANLNDGSASFSLVGRRGYRLPPFSHTTDETPGQPGARYRETRTLERDLRFPLYIETEDVDALFAYTRALANTLDPLLGEGQLRVATGGVDRFANCIYKSGLEGEDVRKSANTLAGWYRPTLVFLAADPYFYDTDETTAEYMLADVSGSSFLGDPFFPLNISLSPVFASPTINNPGDLAVYPVWTITGPGSALVILNKTTGKTIELSTVLGDGQVIQIDTRPTSPSIIDLVTGENLFSDLSFNSALWSLATGDNEVDLQMDGASETTVIAVAYRPTYYGI